MQTGRFTSTRYRCPVNQRNGTKCAELGERCRVASNAYDAAASALDIGLRRPDGATPSALKAEYDARIDLRQARAAYVANARRLFLTLSTLRFALSRPLLPDEQRHRFSLGVDGLGLRSSVSASQCRTKLKGRPCTHTNASSFARTSLMRRSLRSVAYSSNPRRLSSQIRRDTVLMGSLVVRLISLTPLSMPPAVASAAAQRLLPALRSRSRSRVAPSRRWTTFQPLSYSLCTSERLALWDGGAFSITRRVPPRH